MRRVALLLTAFAWLRPAFAQSLPWIEGGVPVPTRIASVEIPEKDEPLYLRPNPRAARRGSAEMGARLPLYAAKRGAGCRGYWLMVGPLAWVCQDRVRLSSDPAVAVRRTPLSMPEGLPYRYHFVGRNGALGYRTLSMAEEVAPDAELEPGFSIAVVHVAKRGGDPFAFTTKNLWVPLRDLGPARALPFQGAEIADGKLNQAWVFADRAEVFDKPGGTRSKSEVRPQWERLEVLDTVEKKERRWFRIGDGRWVSDRDVRAPTSAPIPGDAAAGERWIDVDIANQVLTAYEGERPVFATLVSTGKGKGKSILATPVGSHRIWVKLLSSDMDNLENEEASRYYAIQDVPWVMYFEKGYGLHGTFWHRSFGRIRSHGCVNLSPLDAQRLFNWTGPTLPAGWTAALPSPYDRGTLIRVR
jgi:lipoprotein-anchoring transpeptidase ErfK/SrfK